MSDPHSLSVFLAPRFKCRRGKHYAANSIPTIFNLKETIKSASWPYTSQFEIKSTILFAPTFWIPALRPGDTPFAIFNGLRFRILN